MLCLEQCSPVLLKAKAEKRKVLIKLGFDERRKGRKTQQRLGSIPRGVRVCQGVQECEFPKLFFKQNSE
uniref:Uncharacterized protein n=1 Tax=Solanum tuberosum TaxID=4113 RepID=M1D6T1_SOLTU